MPLCRCSRVALLFAIGSAASSAPPVRAQTTIPYTSGQTDATARTTTTASPLTLTIGSGSATQSGIIDGDGSVTKLGGGMLTLSGANIYTGGTTVAEGTLAGTTSSLQGNIVDNARVTFNQANSGTYAGAISGTGNVTILGTGPVIFTGANTYAGTTSLSTGGSKLQIGDGGNTGSITGNVSLLTGATLTFNRSDTATYVGIINSIGSGTTIVQAGSGTLTLSGASIFTGNLVVSAGTLTFSAANRINNAGNVTVAAGANYDLDGFAQTTTNLTAAGTISLGSGTLTVNGSSTISGNISGSGGITIGYGANVTLSGTNTYTGPTTNSASTSSSLQVTNRVALYNGNTANWTAANLVITGTLTLNVGGAGEFTASDVATLTALGNTTAGFRSGSVLGLDTTNAGGNFTLGSVIANPNSGANTLGLNKLGNGTLTLTANNTYTGNTTISAGTLQLGNGGTSGTAGTGGAAIRMQGGDLIVNRSNNQTLAIVNSLAGNLTVMGGGTVSTSTGPSGNIVISNGGLSLSGTPVAATIINHGALSVSYGTSDHVITSPISGTGSLSVSTQGGGANQLVGNLSYTGPTSFTNTSGSIAATFQIGNSTTTGALPQGNITVIAPSQSTTLIIDRADTTLSYAGVISNTGASLQFIKQGLGTLVFTGNNSFTGNTTISTGTLQLGNGGTSGIVLGNITNNSALVFDRSDAVTFAGVISGSGSLGKSGTGTLTLSGASTFTGDTTLNAGTLIVNGSLANTAVSVTSGATLGGSGTIGGATAIADGGHLAPGNSPGTLTFTNGLTLTAGAILDFQLGTTSDLIAVTDGMLTGPGTGNLITFNLTDAGGFHAGTYPLLNYTTASGTSGFGATAFVMGSSIAGYTYNFSIADSTLQLTATASAIPEPSTYATLFGVVALGIAAWCRQRRP